MEIKKIAIPGFQTVIEAVDSQANLHCFIAIHDSTLGPALGGLRMFPYGSTQAALEDVLRLAQGMTYKSALAETGLGGGKSAIIGDPETDKTEAMLLAFGEVLDSLKGSYIVAEDVGTSPDDMLVIRKKTPYVSALPTERSSGDPSQFTAWGVFRGMQAVAQTLWGSPSLKGKVVAIQGLGHVGSKLAAFLFWEGARLILTDPHTPLVVELAHQYGAQIAHLEDIYQVECDIFSPCAMGGILNDCTIPLLKGRAVAGSANNQLAAEVHGKMLMEKGILYAPDYIINAGGLINVTIEFEPEGYHSTTAREKIDRIYERLLNLFRRSYQEKRPPCQIADEIAQYNIQNQIGKRTRPIIFKNS